MYRVFISENDDYNVGLKEESVTFFSRVPCSADWRYPLHVHAGQYELICMLSGVLKSTIEGTTYSFRRGDLVMIRPGIVHANQTEADAPADFYVLNIDKAAMEEFDELFGLNKFLSINAEEHFDFLSGSLKELMLLLNNEDRGYTDIIQSLISSVIRLVRRLFLTQTAQAYSEHFQTNAHSIFYYITEHYNEPITLKRLSEHFFISPTHLSRLFSNTFGISPISFLIDYRIGKAQEMMGSNLELSTAAVAERIGFSNVNHFINTFTKRVGCTPSEYRARYI